MNAAALKPSDAVYHSALRFITGSIYKKCMFLLTRDNVHFQFRSYCDYR